MILNKYLKIGQIIALCGGFLTAIGVSFNIAKIDSVGKWLVLIGLLMGVVSIVLYLCGKFKKQGGAR